MARQARLFAAGAAPAQDPAALRSALLAWFAANRRALPWRRDRDPYRVWISEAMLQQTRVGTVIPYYERFLARWPDVASLAAADEEDVVAAWSGLGYYRRARSLHAAARAVVARHAGRLPRSREALLALPGFGPYTAGAVASIAHGLAEPVVDGNVARVFARLFAIDLEHGTKALGDELWRRARELVPASGAGDWNQALMELGALVCTPREPACGACPLARHCLALREERTGELPRARRRPQPLDVDLLVVVVARGDELLLERRPERGRMARMWQLPTAEPADEPRLHPRELPRAVARGGEELGSVRHSITRHRIRARVERGRASGEALGADLAWVARGALEELALTGLTRKVLAAPFFPRPERARCAG